MRVLLPSSVLTCLPSQLSVLPKSAPLHDVHHCKMPFKRIERRTLSMRSSAPSNDNNASSLMKNLWQHFGNTNPDALKIYALFDNQPVHNDHIAFRTLQNAHLGKEVIAQLVHQQLELVVAASQFLAQPLLLVVQPQGLGEAEGGGLQPQREWFRPGPAIGIHPQGPQQQRTIPQGQPAPGFA